MAPITKRRPDVSVEVLESTSSPEPSRGDKRLRLSTTAPPDNSDGSASSPHDNDNGDPPPSTQARDLIATQAEFEALRDQPSDDESHQNENKKANKIRREMENPMDNTARENGIIEKVSCINFMCHKHLTIELGPLINFIIGHNGSGKSAVLTAIQLCLGGKATSTNRGQSLKSFVKEGEESAVLIVKIKNGGESGYRPEIYGDAIFVERHFSRSGPSSFKIKTTNGRIVSTKRSELDDICDFYAFQLDNPVNVLTQDMARQFLNNSSEADKYRFFIKGVQLEQLNNDYTLVWESLNSTEAQLENVSENAHALKQVAKEARSKYEELSKQNDLRTKIEKYRRQVAWVQVEQEEKKLEEDEQGVKDADARIERAQAQAQTFEEAYTAANQSHEDCTADHRELVGELDPLNSRQQEAKSAFEANTAELLKHQSEQRQAHTQWTQAKTRVERLQKDIQDERQRLEDADGGANATKLAEIEEAEQKVVEAKQKVDEHPQSKSPLESDLDVAEHRFADAKDAKARKGQEVERAEKQLQNLKNDRGDRRQQYHPTLVQFERAIQYEKRWREQPVGPLGDHIQLLKPEWSSIMERTFGNALGGFIVTSKHDEKLLSDIARKSKYFAPIYLTRSNPIDTSGHEPDQRFDTMMRILKVNPPHAFQASQPELTDFQFDNDLVRNQAIIAQNVDQILLIRDREEAEKIMFGSGPPPRYAKAAVCINKSRRGWGIRLFRSEGNNQKIDAITAWDGRSRFKTDIETQIRMNQDAIQGLKQELGELENVCRQLQDQVKKCKQAIKAHENRDNALRVEHQEAEDLVASLKDELEAAAPQDGKLDGLKDQLDDAEEERDLNLGQYEESKNVKSTLDAKAASLKRAVEEVNAEVDELKHRAAKAEKKVQKAADKRQTRLREKNEAFEAIKDAERLKAQSEERRKAQIEHLEKYLEGAGAISSRVPVDRGETFDSLSKKYDRMREQLSKAERELGGTREQIAARATETHVAWERVEQSRRNLINLEQTLKKSIRDRSWRWRQFRSQISSRARIQFIYLMSERGFHGRLRLDHSNKLLELNVQPDKSVNAKRGEQRSGATTTLSGGEKSYSTICLLLALWDAMGSPIRCLDEFDVFMDSVNRDYSMKLMIGAARRSVGRQFILITPQAMDKVSHGPDVKVHRMADPERGQTALSFRPE